MACGLGIHNSRIGFGLGLRPVGAKDGLGLELGLPMGNRDGLGLGAARSKPTALPSLYNPPPTYTRIYLVPHTHIPPPPPTLMQALRDFNP
ncbi:hypothetical protein AMTR_s00067p00161730 [Amborella trichopoda]|uniref:Uncharacterized protein n=1 Tax=Amborella trichopoda TaxID=13333 RepID=U5DBT8_AMBTC|nr:hypothetical protein AMTR_s00067p00161730 [Amborella trichopoda]